MLLYVRIPVEHHLLRQYVKITELKTFYKIFVTSPIPKLLLVI